MKIKDQYQSLVITDFEISQKPRVSINHRVRINHLNRGIFRTMRNLNDETLCQKSHQLNSISINN